MAITRAQIPEQVDLFDEGGEVLSSLTPEDIISLYGAQRSAPVTKEDIETQAAQMAGLFAQPKKQNIFDLASEVGAGLQGLGAQAAGASASDIAALYGMGAQQQV